MHLSLFITFPPNILVCPLNIFDKSTPVTVLMALTHFIASPLCISWLHTKIGSVCFYPYNIIALSRVLTIASIVWTETVHVSETKWHFELMTYM